MEYPEWLDDIWAKSSSSTGENGESLASHTFGALTQLAAMIKLRPQLPEQIGVSRLWHCLFWAMWLHDFGKAASGFQATLKSGKPWPFRHEILSLAFLPWMEDGLTEEERLWVVVSILFHHKDMIEVETAQMYMDGSDDDPLYEMAAQLDEDVLQRLGRWIEEYASGWIYHLELGGYQVSAITPKGFNPQEFKQKAPEVIRKYIASALRWLRSIHRNRQVHEFVGTIVLRGHTLTSDHSASAHIGFMESPLGSADTLLNVWGKDFNSLYPHQHRCMDSQGSTILISPTGSGKTEAALLWACSQQHGGQGLPRLFYCLPYQASMNAMYNRLQNTSFANAVGLEHSRSMLTLYRRFLEDDNSPDGALHKAKVEKALGRLHYYPVRVLSPYQILKAPYRLKGYETLLTDCCQAAFVLDEIHAYEPARLALILALVRYLSINFNARFFVMSATLPDMVISKLQEALGPISCITASAEIFERFTRHKVFLCGGDLLEDTWIEHVVDDALQGKSVLVCCNTVDRAQKAYNLLQKRLTTNHILMVLLHGRFNGYDRLQKEQLIQDKTGTNTEHQVPIVVVATQVVEVSLDIDLDVLYSDPAPLEALLQRFGRINRKKRHEWAPVFVFTEPADGQAIYAPELIRRTLTVIEGNSGQYVREDKVSEQLKQIYQGPVLEEWNIEYEKNYREFSIACLNTLWAFNADKRLEDLFYQAFDSVEVLPEVFRERYQQLMLESKPLEASQLTVAISWKKYCELEKRKLIYGDRVPVVNLQYSPELGLQYE